MSPLTQYRKDQKLTLEQLGKKLGKVNKSTILRWESGRVRIPAERVFAISQITQIPFEELRPDLFHNGKAA